ncbi:hypothetical protein HLB35_14805 [Halomonas sp. TBZ9]|uniref:Uncharacterized protein n=1 Tax=Vreelandella azerica TaxID=2732867 RepID=A0A7Y3TYT9_9GAMM|nr:hypothetical protein [Halomonas azerica]NOG32708.1 hypothetical protein [Halomonas azerica]
MAFSSQYTLAAFFVMVCGIGFSTMLVKRMAEDSGANFLNYSLSAIFIGGAVAFIGLYLVSFF